MPTLESDPSLERFDVRVRDAVDDAEWSVLLGRDPRAHVAQRPSFQRILSGPHARWMEVRDRFGSLRAGLGFEERSKGPLRTRVSGVGGTYGGPVAGCDDAAAESALAVTFCRGGLRAAHLEMVWAGEEPPRGPWRGVRALPTAELRIDPARSFDHFLSTVFGRKGRKECNRSERRGFVARREDDGHAWSEFSAQLRARSEAWGTHLPTTAAVEELVRGHEEVALFAVRDAQGAVVGVHLTLVLARELFAWIGTTARIEGVNAATLLLREEARFAHARGLHGVNLGSSLGIAGVQRYKEMLGASEGSRWIVRWQPAWRRAWRRAWDARDAKGPR